MSLAPVARAISQRDAIEAYYKIGLCGPFRLVMNRFDLARAIRTLRARRLGVVGPQGTPVETLG